MRKALIFGGAGQIGSAIAQHLAQAGWEITAVTRQNRPLPYAENIRIAWFKDPGKTRTGIISDIGGAFDAVIDPTAYDGQDSADLLASEAKIGAIVSFSSSSVYADPEGRSLDEARETGFPEFPIGIPETTPTVTPGPETYSTRKVAMEKALEKAKIPVLILRPCAIYGLYARELREAWILRRLAENRNILPISHDAESIFHTSSASGIASLIACALRDPKNTTLNVADPDALSVRGIIKAVSIAIGKTAHILPFPGEPKGMVGRTPWTVARPYVLDTSRARTLGWDGGAPYEEAVTPLCAWAMDQATKTSWDAAFPLYKAYGVDMFDYEAEDKFLAERA